MFALLVSLAVLASHATAFCPGINQAGLDLLKEFEGFVAAPAPDPIGLPTVGYGHQCQQAGCAEISQSFPLTEATAQDLLEQDIPTYTKCLGDALSGSSAPPLNENQWAALTSFVYNMGCGQAADSDVITRIKAGEDPNTVVAQALPSWNHAGGEELPGLTRRRAAEVALFQAPNEPQAFPGCTALGQGKRRLAREEHVL